MTPGELPSLHISSQLERISPSRFVALDNCNLRELWVTPDQSPLLPVSPRARLGSIVHRLLELANNGLPEKEIAKAWDELVRETETRMSRSWLERSHTPLNKTVNDFEVQRLRAWNRAKQMAQSAAPIEESAELATGFGYEIWAQSKDGDVGGYIDAVYDSPNGAVIIDFKSGPILEDDGNSGKTIHADYLLQVKLYAALYNDTFGEWPSSVELMPVQGDSFGIIVDPAECMELLKRAKAKRLEVNSRISAALKKGPDAISTLANPSASNCRFCLWRPACSAYTKQSQNSADSEWPADIVGTLTSSQLLGNGRVLLTVTDAAGEQRRVRHLDPSPTRHPAVPKLKIGDRVGIFNTRRNPNQGDFAETNSTTIYRMSDGIAAERR
jgi:hypothetical protein